MTPCLEFVLSGSAHVKSFLKDPTQSLDPIVPDLAVFGESGPFDGVKYMTLSLIFQNV